MANFLIRYPIIMLAPSATPILINNTAIIVGTNGKINRSNKTLYFNAGLRQITRNDRLDNRITVVRASALCIEVCGLSDVFRKFRFNHNLNYS